MNNRPRAVVVLISVFLAGCIIGATGSFYWLRKHPESLFRTNMGPYRMWNQRQKNPMEDLKLTPQQEAGFKEIMDGMRKKLDGLRMEQDHKFEAIRAETNQKLLAIMNEEQQKKFTEFIKQMEDARKRMPRRMDRFEPPRR
jgi:Spy/CpxP family protein refolding chaperone